MIARRLIAVVILLGLAACAQANPEATPTPPPQPTSTPTNIIVQVDIFTSTPEPDPADLAEEIWIAPLEDFPSGEGLVYYDWEEKKSYLLSADQQSPDLQVSNRWGKFSQDGSQFVTLIDNKLVVIDATSSSRSLSTLDKICRNPAWSPNADRLAFICEWDGVYIYSIEDDSLQHLTNWAHPSVHSFLYPVWSPDGKWIAYAYRSLSSLQPQFTDGVYIIPVDCLESPPSCEGQTRGPFTNYTDPSSTLIAWSPDSQSLVTYEHQRHEIKIVDLETGESKEYPLEVVDYIDGLAWSLEGNWITFSYWGSIYQLSPDTGDTRLLAENKGDVVNYLTITRETPEPNILGLSQPLRELLIIWNDVEEYYDHTGIYPQISYIFEDLEYTVRDASAEIADECELGCTRQIWKTETLTDIGFDDKEFDYYYEVILEMYLQEDAASAREYANSLFEDHLPDLREEIDRDDWDYGRVSAPETNTRIGILDHPDEDQGINVLVTTSAGPISYRIFSHMPPWHDDLSTFAQMGYDFLNAQINQVEKAYIFPTLSDLMLNRTDILDVIEDYDKVGWMYIKESIDTDSFYIFDRTDEIEGSCQFECTRQEITSHELGIIITMVNTKDENEAHLAAEQLYAELEPYHYEWESSLARGFLPPDHTRIGLSDWNNRILVVSWAGPIAIRVEILGPYSSDASWETGTVCSFAHVQLEKLKQAKFIP